LIKTQRLSAYNLRDTMLISIVICSQKNVVDGVTGLVPHKDRYSSNHIRQENVMCIY
jgi:hypothetical protein